MHRVTQSELASSDKLYQVPIGKPVPGWECFLYDDETDTVINALNASAVSAGTTRSASGVCYVRGPGVLKAYLNRDDLTQAAFLSAHDRLQTAFSVSELCRILCVMRLNSGCRFLFFASAMFVTTTQTVHLCLRAGKRFCYSNSFLIVLHFCCRRDNQIKIQGQRMEPGEVEAVVASLDDVSGCIVKLIKPVQVNTFSARMVLVFYDTLNT